MVENIVQQGYNVYDGKQDNFSWKSFAHDGVVGAAMGALMRGLKQLCFDGDTAVQVPATDKRHGVRVASVRNVAVVAATTKPIRSIRAGDPVFARDERTGRTVIAKVRQVFVRTSDHLISVTFSASRGGPVIETLKTTRQHPFYVDGKGWLPAGGLAIGNAIVTRAGPRLFVKSVGWHRRAQGYTVYNFEVEPLNAKGSDGGKGAGGKFTHSYFVGSAGGGVWVHNAQYSLAKLQHEFKHAPDFGVTGNWNSAKRVAFQSAIEGHVNTATEVGIGTYRGQWGTHFYEPSNGLWAFFDSSDNYVASWKLYQSQKISLYEFGGFK